LKGERPGSVQTSTLMICDFDGTVSQTDIGYEILRKFSGDKWEDIDRAYRRGVIGSMDAYKRIASFIHMPEEEVISYLEDVNSIDPHFAGIRRLCKERSIDLKIVSDGLDYYIRNILDRHGFSDIEFFSNRLVFLENSRIRIDFPGYNEKCGKCGNCKKRILEKHRQDYCRIIYVGDGYSDICPSVLADLVFGKDILYTSCREKGTHCIYYRNLGEVKEILERRGCLAV